MARAPGILGRHPRLLAALAVGGAAALLALVLLTRGEESSRTEAAARSCGAPAGLTVPPYAEDSVFNQPIPADAKADPDSDRLVAGVVEAARDTGFVVALKAFTVPVYVASRDTPRYDVSLTASWAPRTTLDAVPIPAEARPDPADDGHLAVVDRLRGCEYDLWQARKEGDRWSASWGNVIPTQGRGIYPDGLSARASGFGLLAGLIFPEELAQGEIEHALVFSYPLTRAGGPVPPATDSDGLSTRPDAIPEGARLQLDPTLDLDALGLAGPERAVARALQRYGMFLADTGGAVSLYAEHPKSSGARNPYAGIVPDESSLRLERIPLDRLRVLELGPQQSGRLRPPSPD